MVTPQSPFSFLDEAIQKVGSQLQPPEWAVQEAQRRIVLLLNHVLQQEPEATRRLFQLSGKVVMFHWRQFHFKLRVTPAGLLDLAEPDVQADLSLSVTEESARVLVQSALSGQRPAVRIEGDVELAAAVNWVVEHARWDLEEDLARVIGDAPAHALSQAARRLRDGVRTWLDRPPGGQR